MQIRGWDFLLHALFLRTLEDLSLGGYLLIWLIRILTLSLLFRTYIGPAIVSLVSRRLRIRSVSLRSIRGIYFKGGSGTWRVERVGISYHRPSRGKASRFSVKVQGLSFELDGHTSATPRRVSPMGKSQKISRANPSQSARHAIWTLLSVIYTALEPYCRPVVRTFFVSLLRFGISALPALTQVVDFELDSAILTCSTAQGVELSVGDAKLHTRVTLASFPSVVTVKDGKGLPSTGHRRFASVADWNARLRGSLKRTWDRAWGTTRLAASINMHVYRVNGSVDSTSSLFAGSHRGHHFLDVPEIRLSVSARLDPHRGIQARSIEAALDLGTVNIQLDVVQKLAKLVKERHPTESCDAAAPIMNGSSAPASAASPGASPAWASSLSPSSPFMGALSASMRWKRTVRQSRDRKDVALTATKRVSYASYIKLIEMKMAKCTASYQPDTTPSEGPAVMVASVTGFLLNAGLSHPDRNEMHRRWLGSSTGDPRTEPSADTYSIEVSAKQFILDRNGVGELMDHLRIVTLNSLRWESLLARWPAPWLQGSSFLSGDPNAQLFASQLSLSSVEATERLDMLEKYAHGGERSVEKAVHGQSILPPILTPVPRVSLSIDVGDISFRLISPTCDEEQDPFVLEARTSGICGSVTSEFFSRPDNAFEDMERDYMGLDLDFTYGIYVNRSLANMWFGPDAHMRGAHPQSFHAASYPSENLVQVDAIHLSGNGRGLGEFADEAGGVVSVDAASIFTLCQVATDALSIELWQPNVVKALSCILARTGGRSAEKQRKPSRRVLDQLPFGVSACLSVGRLMLFVTSPDLAPDDTLNISRGLASRVGISLDYCALRPSHCLRIPAVMSRVEGRSRLRLPSEQLLRVVEDVSLSRNSDIVRALVSVSLWDMVFRDAFATPFAADDPYGTSEGSSQHRSLEFLHVEKAEVGITVSGSRPNGAPLPNDQDSCEVEITVPRIKAVMHLAQIYNALLAVHTLQLLIPSLSSATASRSPPTIYLDVRCHLHQLQLRWGFPLSTKIFMRMSSAWCHINPNRRVTVGWDHILLAVAVSVSGDGVESQQWEELARLPLWRVELAPSTPPLKVKVKGDSARLRIPFDFVLADLILDINLTVKSVKHLLQMVSTGKFQDPPAPPEEDAKHVPDIHMELGRLLVEAADDDFESRLGLIWQTGFHAARVRQERDEAFEAKVETIVAPPHSGRTTSSRNTDSDFQFTPKHTVSIADARYRLQQIHSMAWIAAFRQAQSQQIQREECHLHAREGSLQISEDVEADLVSVNKVRPVPPLVHLAFHGLSLSISPPSFPYDALPDYLYDAGRGLPRDTRFSLLIPMHVHFKASSLRLTFREYPLPLLHIPPHSNGFLPAMEFDSDIVIAEEMGSDKAVEWIKCEIVKADNGMPGAAPISVRIPKTIMPVKSYASPTIHVTTDGVTDFSWGVSYGAATQDFMRVIDTLSHAPRDSSPAIGFWDKLRLVLHWRVRVDFVDEVHLHMKGSRDPYELRGYGAGFALCWKGNPSLLIGQPNDAGELIQVKSDTMLVIVPNIEDSYGDGSTKAAASGSIRRTAQTICAKFRSGVCFGVGFVLERACGPECSQCKGKPFDRECRLFDFKPHYAVKLEWKDRDPEVKSSDDSYDGFRSDFIHMSISLTSGLQKTTRRSPSNFHLSPEIFSHFWSWWHLFNGTLSLPIRQGKLYPRRRPISPKFGHHLATLKYMASVPMLYISHVYVDNSQEAWADGVTPFVGVKALINEFHADMHQRDTETSEMTHGGLKKVHHKPFYAIEVVLKGLDLRAMLAVFPDPLKQCTPLENTPLVSNYRTRNNLTPIDLTSDWVDMDDFAVYEEETPSLPDIYLLPAASCPRFTYFKRVDEYDSSGPEKPSDRTKFGSERTHVCLIGKEASVTQIQMDLASARVEQLRQRAHDGMKKTRWQKLKDSLAPSDDEDGSGKHDMKDLPRMIALLEGYIAQLRQLDMASQASTKNGTSSYYMPVEMVSPEEWAGFDNVYQVHCPQIIMDNAVRDIMMQYYYCSRFRRGIEYHMATRAVKFIRDQAQAALAEFHREAGKHKGPAASAQAAAVAVKKLLMGEGGATSSVEFVPQTVSKLPASVDPLHGWGEGVSARKGHFCLLLKPQVVLRSNADTESVCILAAVQGKLKTFAIMDDSNAQDPVSGKVMNRNFAWLTGLQTFSPSATNVSGKEYVPLEVLIDLRADNGNFDRLVPQTDATFQYDKFNRLRLRNDVTSVAKNAQHTHAHLQNQTDLIRLHVPRFTVSANDRHFQAISNIVTNLVLFTDAAHKTRAEKLEGLLFSYDFTNLGSAADVVANMQQRLRQAIETKREAEPKLLGYGNPGRVELLKIDAHILLLIEELNLIFDAIKLAQDKANDQSDQKSALLLHASSEELSWRMLDGNDQLLAKLAVRDTDFYWLSRHDSSTVNKLAVGDLQAFDGAADAEWTEILSKYDEPATHPLVKRKLFLLADWTVLPPVGGITIYEEFELMLHPMRLQIDIRVGRKIMEYLWPARRNRKQSPTETESFAMPEPLSKPDDLPVVTYSDSPRHASFDLPARTSLDTNRLAAPTLRRLGSSRSFTDLRNTRQDSLQVPRMHRTRSSDALKARANDGLSMSKASTSGGGRHAYDKDRSKQELDDAAEMKTRASQKTFVRVKVASLHLLLSIMKEDSFLCRDARIRTRDLEYRNQTWSFEELVDQFIPSGRNWRGWVKVAFQQPLVPVLPVAREIITKTKWIAMKKDAAHDRPTRPSTPKVLSAKSGVSRGTMASAGQASRDSTDRGAGRPELPHAVSDPPLLTSEPDTIRPGKAVRPGGMRRRAISLFKRKHAHSQDSIDSSDTTTSTVPSPQTEGQASVDTFPDIGRENV